MKLYGSLTSPFVRKVRVVLAEKKLDYQFEQENVWANDNMRSFNPLGQVPCLVTEGGEAFYDSRVIVEYLDTLSPVGKLIPASGRERWDVKILEAEADGVMDASVKIFLEQNWAGRSAEQRSPAWVARQVGKIEATLAHIAAKIEDKIEGKSWSAGTQLTLADVALGSALDYLALRCPSIDWKGKHPSLVKLMDKLNKRQSFKSSRPPA